MGNPAVSLASGVVRIPTLGDFINSFAFTDSDGSVTLVDCGLKRAPARIVAGLADIGKHPRDVTRIILTHAHPDHAGGARAMLDATGVAGVDAHESDAEFMRRGAAPPRDTSTTSGRIFERLPTSGFDPIPVTSVLKDGDLIPVAGGIRVVHTPGHTPGHVSLLHESSGVLITGDSIFNIASRRTWPLAAFCTSFAQSKATAAILADLEYGIAAFTHGPEIRDHARERIRQFLRTRGHHE
jgi:glyoxylase-like metal-dependent hydrolase (beta-lactamase superfamily II)